MPGNVSKSVFQSLSVSSHLRLVNVAIKKNARQSMERIFFLPCLLWDLTTMLNLSKPTCKSTANPLKGRELGEQMDLKRELKNHMVSPLYYCFYGSTSIYLSGPVVDSGASNHTVSVLSADGQLNQQGNVIYTTYPGPQITQFQLG